jgi:hypothetical protein
MQADHNPPAPSFNDTTPSGTDELTGVCSNRRRRPDDMPAALIALQEHNSNAWFRVLRARVAATESSLTLRAKCPKRPLVETERAQVVNGAGLNS